MAVQAKARNLWYKVGHDDRRHFETPWRFAVAHAGSVFKPSEAVELWTALDSAGGWRELVGGGRGSARRGFGIGVVPHAATERPCPP